METRTRSRPELRPVCTSREQHSAYPRTTPQSATGPLFSASLSLPSPMYPASPGYDYAMRAHERALVDRLDQRGRRESPHQQSPTTARSLSPKAEQTMGARRDSVASLPLPRAPALSPRSQGFAQYPGPQTIAAQTREILLRGLPDGLPRSPLDPSSATDDRRQLLPPWLPGARRGSQQVREELQSWGHVYYGNSSIADCFVSAVALRRHSDSSSADEDATPKESPPRRGRNRVIIRARVRPCALDRKPFLLRRTFDMDELRATIPELSSVASSGSRRPSAEHLTRSPLPASRRRSSLAASANHGLDLDRSHVQSTNTVPIHLKYARAFLPVLAALLYSGHIRKGDIVDLPLPYPEAWTQTVAHVYTGQGELTQTIKQNILYLGGKI
ncbi:hypothetical protein N657DRAFT_561199 [Parathielavia appendiculata]|uniref:Uncharacterized protein n=1 Tax=Parathielavia appendiculata TaxID=2587402 RepID=A0AAN6Z9W3_9PEZI|nr:hypothetical protein N657DRAFT_561199 [Parathielavia appendiculata]